MDPTPDNRRESARVKVRWSANIQWPQHGSATGVVCNISTSGAYLETVAEFKVGDSILFSMRVVSTGQTNTVHAQATILRHVFLSDLRGNGYGLLFTQIAAEDRSFLFNAIELLQTQRLY